MMKRILFFFFAVTLLIPVSLSAEEVVRLTRYMGENLTGVSASHLFEVELISSRETKAVVEVPLELEEYLVFEKNADGVVRVDMQLSREANRRYSSGNYWDTRSVKLKLYTPTIEYIKLSSLAKVSASGPFTGNQVQIHLESVTKLNGFDIAAAGLRIRMNGTAEARIRATARSADLRLDGAGKLNLNLNGNETVTANIGGAGRLDLNLPHNDRIDLKVGSAGVVNLTGTGTILEVDAGSAAKVQAKEFPVERAGVTASSAAQVTVHATRYLKIEASSVAKVQYTGNPVEKHISNPNVTEIK